MPQGIEKYAVKPKSSQNIQKLLLHLFTAYNHKKLLSQSSDNIFF